MPTGRTHHLFFCKLLFLLLIRVQLPAQISYSDYIDTQKEFLVNEQFNSSQHNFPMDHAKLDNGLLAVSDGWSRATNPKTFIVVNVDKQKDFEIEILAYSNSKLAFGSISCNNIWWKLYPGSFELYSKGSRIKSTRSILIENSILTKYTLRKIGAAFHFFVNEKYYTTYNPGSDVIEEKLEIGFAGKLIVDYISISYLLKEPKKVDLIYTTQPNRTNPAANGTEIKKIIEDGKYFGLIVGVSDYNDPKMKLDHPSNDAYKLKEILLSRYTFTDSTTFLIINPTRQKLIAELFRLRKIIGPNDNLLIFYASHGHWDEEARQGYWWPKDATTEDPSNWLSNSDLREQIRSIKSAHTLLISDACFSGGIFKTRGGNDIMNASKDIQLLYKMPSRRAMTSGTMTTVPDKSVFLEYLCKRLKDNNEKFLSSQYLFDSFRAAVINNSNVVPQDGVIAETGDEGGDFIFILKENN